VAEEQPQADEKVRRLIRWKDADIDALVEQLRARVEDLKRQGREVSFMGCLIWEGDEGGRHYQPFSSSLPPEILMWAVHEMERRIDKAQFEEDSV
jgi:hypothetical protein